MSLLEQRRRARESKRAAERVHTRRGRREAALARDTVSRLGSSNDVFFIGLFDATGNELSYPGYQRQEMRFDKNPLRAPLAPRSVNDHPIVFPSVPPGYANGVYEAKVFSERASHHSVPLWEIRLSQPLLISHGITMCFSPGAIQLDVDVPR